MAEILVDTDVFVDHLRRARRFEPGKDRVSYSTVTRAELFAGSSTDERVVRELLEPFRELPVDTAVAERGGRLRREHGVALPDALLAATALEHGLTLVTRNRRHFEPIPRLRLADPTRPGPPSRRRGRKE